MKSPIKKTERWIQWSLIPASAIITAVLMAQEPEGWPDLPFWQKFLESFFAILFIWYLVKGIVTLFRKIFPSGKRDALRISLQAVSSMVVTSTIILGINLYYAYAVNNGLDFWDCFQYTKLLYLAGIVFGFLMIALFESLYLLEELMASQVKAEQIKKEGAIAQVQGLKQQLNPHFLFNSLNTLTTVIEESPKTAVDFVQELSEVYRYVLRKQEEDWVKLDEELQFAESYIYLLKMRYEDSLVVSLDISDKDRQCFVPPMSLQILLENAIKHNEISTRNPLTVSVNTSGDELIVSNNKKVRPNVIGSNGIGLSNIRNRYQFLAGKEVTINETTEVFEVRLPLLNIKTS